MSDSNVIYEDTISTTIWTTKVYTLNSNQDEPPQLADQKSTQGIPTYIKKGVSENA